MSLTSQSHYCANHFSIHCQQQRKLPSLDKFGAPGAAIMSYPGLGKKSSSQMPAPVNRIGEVPRPRLQHPRQFDPEELSRRLYMVLAEQQSRTEKKKRPRAEGEAAAKPSSATESSARTNRTSGRTGRTEKSSTIATSAQTKSTSKRGNVGDSPSSVVDSERNGRSSQPMKRKSKANLEGAEAQAQPSTYRHVPQVAASQFARTTTAQGLDDHELIHKLSKAAMKFHLDRPGASQEVAPIDGGTAPCETARSLRSAQSKREQQYDRNQFQHPPIMGMTFDFEPRQDPIIQRQTFDTRFKSKGKPSAEEQTAKRMSIGSVFQTRDSSDLPSLASPIERQDSRDASDLMGLAIVNDHRVDWTQSDEIPSRLGSPQLRKSESKWAFRSRLGSFQKPKEETLSPPNEEVVSDDSLQSPKSPRYGFFSRFKR